MTNTPARRWPKTGTVGASTTLGADEQPVTVPARPYPGEEVVTPLSNRVPLGDLVPALRRVDDPPTPAELREIADSLNAHGGLDEVFVAELLRQAADPLADAKRGLGIVDTPPPVTTTEPITYETIVEALEKIAPLGPQRLDVVKLTQEQIDAVTASQPHVAPSAEPWHYFGTPVEIVETIEESTPYRERLRTAAIEAMADVETVGPCVWPPTPVRPRPWWRRVHLDRVLRRRAR